MSEAIIIGLISDTHGLVRPEVFEALQGVSRIFHAGDVGPPDVLIELATIAPVQAVWGNTDAPGRPDLVERIEVPGEGAPQIGWVMATNLYLKTPLGWRIAAHHASPGLPDELAMGADGDAPTTLH